MPKLTKKQQAVLEAIQVYINQNHYPPTVRELCQALDLASPSTVHNHLDKLKEKGYVTWVESKPRTLRVII